MKVIGIQKNVSFDINGRTIEGINLYLSEIKNGVDGVATKKMFINTNRSCYKAADSLKLGQEIKVYFDEYKNPAEIVIV